MKLDWLAIETGYPPLSASPDLALMVTMVLLFWIILENSGSYKAPVTFFFFLICMSRFSNLAL